MQIIKEEKQIDVFKHEEKYGESNFSVQLLNELKGKPLEEQIERFFFNQYTEITYYSYGEEDGGKSYDCIFPVWKHEDFLGVLEKDGVIVGVLVEGVFGKKQPLYLHEKICVYSVSDDDGTGSTDREDYLELFIKE